MEKLYTSKRASCAFAGAEKVKRFLGTKAKKVDKELCAIPAYATHRPLRKRFTRRKVYVPTLHYQIGADLIEVKHPRSNYNKRYILGMVDHFSRMGWLEPLKTKSADDVLEAAKRIFKRSKGKYKFFTSDDGKEFTNKKFKEYLNTQGIHPFVTASSTKCCINERFNRTIMTRVARYLTHAKSKRYIHKLKDFERQYNNTFHRTINCKPRDVTEQTAPLVWESIYGSQNVIKKDKQLKVGDLVLIPRKKGLFEKGYSATFGTEVFRIKEVKKTSPTTYVLETKEGDEITGSFYKAEMVNVPESFPQ